MITLIKFEWNYDVFNDVRDTKKASVHGNILQVYSLDVGVEVFEDLMIVQWNQIKIPAEFEEHLQWRK